MSINNFRLSVVQGNMGRGRRLPQSLGALKPENKRPKCQAWRLPIEKQKIINVGKRRTAIFEYKEFYYFCPACNVSFVDFDEYQEWFYQLIFFLDFKLRASLKSTKVSFDRARALAATRRDVGRNFATDKGSEFEKSEQGDHERVWTEKFCSPQKEHEKEWTGDGRIFKSSSRSRNSSELAAEEERLPVS